MSFDFSAYISDCTRDFTRREWVFERIDSWLADPGGRPFFIITGSPGVGKSALAARLAQFSWGSAAAPAFPLLAPGFLAYFHFCRGSELATFDPMLFVETLSESLAAHDKPFARARAECTQGDPRFAINVTLRVGRAADGSQVQNMDMRSLQVREGSIQAQAAFDRLVRCPLEELARQQLGQPVVILVDAIDEALDYRGEMTIATLLARAHRGSARPTS